MVIEKIFQATIVGLSIIAPGKQEAAQETNLRDTATEVAKQIPMSFGTASGTNSSKRLKSLESRKIGTPSWNGRSKNPRQEVQPRGSNSSNATSTTRRFPVITNCLHRNFVRHALIVCHIEIALTQLYSKSTYCTQCLQTIIHVAKLQQLGTWARSLDATLARGQCVLKKTFCLYSGLPLL